MKFLKSKYYLKWNSTRVWERCCTWVNQATDSMMTVCMRAHGRSGLWVSCLHSGQEAWVLAVMSEHSTMFSQCYFLTTIARSRTKWWNTLIKLWGRTGNILIFFLLLSFPGPIQNRGLEASCTSSYLLIRYDGGDGGSGGNVMIDSDSSARLRFFYVVWTEIFELLHLADHMLKPNSSPSRLPKNYFRNWMVFIKQHAQKELFFYHVHVMRSIMYPSTIISLKFHN